MRPTHAQPVNSLYFAALLLGAGIAAAAIAVASGPATGMQIQMTASAAMLTVVLAAATYHDVLRFRIPNAITYPAVVFGLALNAGTSATAAWTDVPAASWLGAIGFQQSAYGALAGFGIMAVVFTVTGRGAGDVKLATAIGAMVGPGSAVATIVWTHLLAGAFGVGLVVWTVGLWRLAGFLARLAGSHVLPQRVLRPAFPDVGILKRPVPLAGFFAVGVFLAQWGVGR